MTNKQKALIAGILIVLALIIIISYLSYVGISEDPEKAEEVTVAAENYIDETFDQPMHVVDTLIDQTGIYDPFHYAAIVELEEHDDFRVLVYEHNEANEYQDSYVAEVWEHELETLLTPEIKKRFGQDSVEELWLTYPKDIGYQLGIDHQDVPSLQGQDANPIIRLTLNRGKTDDDEQQLEELVEWMQNELKIPGGNITLSFNDGALIFGDKNIRESF
ncbi:hypothetical protein [Alkalibacillus aidingensis]|uniref:hypothetical protein n=1 Tax=Alkalibacillus aidingensis TaxID=2747607 RepID=UPI0016602241|nr:hypothetical protein [Alkalibacillus aidingensis]